MSQTANPAVITPIDRATKNLTAAIASALKVANELQPLADMANNLTDDIQQKESQLNALTAQFELEFRSQKADLDVRVKENGDRVLSILLSERGLAKISADELTDLQTKLHEAEASNEETVSKAVKAAETALHASYGSKLKEQEAAHKIETAQINAQLASMQERNDFLNEQIATLRQQIDAERTTRLEIAKADAQRQGVVVNAGKQ